MSEIDDEGKIIGKVIVQIEYWQYEKSKNYSVYEKSKLIKKEGKITELMKEHIYDKIGNVEGVE